VAEGEWRNTVPEQLSNTSHLKDMMHLVAAMYPRTEENLSAVHRAPKGPAVRLIKMMVVLRRGRGCINQRFRQFSELHSNPSGSDVFVCLSSPGVRRISDERFFFVCDNGLTVIIISAQRSIASYLL
jgi:hypothetical protein